MKNAGLVPSAAATTKYSLVSTSSAAQADLDGAQSVPGLNPGQTFTDEETVTIQGNTPLGEYRLQACADAGKAVSEDDEADNCLLSAGTILVTTLPDLRLSAVTLANAPVSRHARRHHRRSARWSRTRASAMPARRRSRSRW